MEMTASPYEAFPPNAANYVPLSPMTFLKQAAAIFPDKTAIIDGEARQTWSELELDARRFAGGLKAIGVGLGDTVSVMAPNTAPAFTAHFGVPMIGSVLNMLNIRLDADAIAFQLKHGGCKVLFVDSEFSSTIASALEKLDFRPVVIEIEAPGCPPSIEGATPYRSWLETATTWQDDMLPDDEWRAIALNYTSGTTGNPKGVVYHHRGAYLNAMGNALVWPMKRHPVYLWTLPMFHCNGWCFPWTIAMLAGTNVCLRKVESGAVFESIEKHAVEYLCGAPIVMNMLANAPSDQPRPTHLVKMMTAGSAPPAAVIGALESNGFEVSHVYGLTEVYGPSAVSYVRDEWRDQPPNEQLRLRARQGVAYPTQEDVVVLDPATMQPVPRDGQTMGEVFFRGNCVMKGYLANPAATEEAFAGGWFHTGDLAVWHPDYFIEIKDRAKDIIISGGENISTIEVEEVLYRHPAILEAAVVQQPDARWGEAPCAFVVLKPGAEATAESILEHCRQNLARFKVPKSVIFEDLPKTSTGKIQKYVLRKRAADLASDVEA
jgi:fatty-acyl-CoA synthase